MTEQQMAVAAEVAESMRQAAYKTVRSRLVPEVGEETAQKILDVIAESAGQGLTEQETLAKLQKVVQTPGETVGCAPAIGIGVNGLIYSKVTADVMTK